MTTILIVEDEQQIARVLQLELSFEGYETIVTHTGTDGLLAFHDQPVDLILLDVMLPGMNGLDVLKRIRKHNETIPIILLTAKSEIQDKVNGLDYGANDYVTKPFEFEELLARIRVALRFTTKAAPKQEQALEFEDITLNEQTREVWRAGHLVELTVREFDLLAHFMKHPRLVQSREQILNAVWSYDYFGDTNVVDVYIRYLRQKLDQPFQLPSLLYTVRGVGYVLKEAAHEA
ncbi:response regulator transcription factor [Solibacillus sp. MA9]|uniref:Response regulator transcription factor n=1 Tax=Solibacillus palustris TaxID=2908203 RepID=A0ABS9UBX3_9BACL|nr:response regulator transcription factor [Solibacillus sp. MA9]MCH7321843.1 response regulator transcription factor [Solibacillus sp. MA9]